VHREFCYVNIHYAHSLRRAGPLDVLDLAGLSPTIALTTWIGSRVSNFATRSTKSGTFRTKMALHFSTLLDPHLRYDSALLDFDRIPFATGLPTIRDYD